MFFVIFLTILGPVTFSRIIKSEIDKNRIAYASWLKTFAAYGFAVCVLRWFLPRSHFATWFSILLPLMIGIFAVKWVVARRETQFRDSLGEVLTMVALKMRIGRSFRQAFSEVASESRPTLSGKLSELLSAVVFSQQESTRARNLFLNSVIDELRRIDQQAFQFRVVVRIRQVV